MCCVGYVVSWEAASSHKLILAVSALDRAHKTLVSTMLLELFNRFTFPHLFAGVPFVGQVVHFIVDYVWLQETDVREVHLKLLLRPRID